MSGRNSFVSRRFKYQCNTEVNKGAAKAVLFSRRLKLGKNIIGVCVKIAVYVMLNIRNKAKKVKRYYAKKLQSFRWLFVTKNVGV